jgi:hypothetical protein
VLLWLLLLLLLLLLLMQYNYEEGITLRNVQRLRLRVTSDLIADS